MKIHKIKIEVSVLKNGEEKNRNLSWKTEEKKKWTEEVIFEFCIKNFNDLPYFSWSVGNFVGKMTWSEMHLMHNPLEFAQSVGNFVSIIDPLTTYWRNYIRRYTHRWLQHFK
jgi:hypothetical protein